MNRKSFERLVARGIDRIPIEFRAKFHNLVFQVEGWADEETLDSVGFDDERDLLGYYLGTPLPERGLDFGGALPDVIFLYQGAIELYAEESGTPLMRVIRETLLHEVAHYFGFSEEEMDVIEDIWWGDSEDDARQS